METQHPQPPKRRTARPRKDWREIRDNASAASVGLEMGLAILAGWYLGHLFDGHFETAPWGQLFFLAGGIGAAGKAVWRTIKHAKKVMSRPEPGQAEADRMATPSPEGAAR
ncbi:MAG: AtpZ/AtpI family protein [Deltaproteobacteria bacterium]|nr:AtpZ/AtpI family protein [Deltaproteobacteria bacterium]